MKDKPSFPPRMEGWEYQYERAEKLEQQIAALVEALEAVRSGRWAMKLWVNKNTLRGEMCFALSLSDSALRTFILEKALALVEGDEDGV